MSSLATDLHDNWYSNARSKFDRHKRLYQTGSGQNVKWFHLIRKEDKANDTLKYSRSLTVQIYYWESFWRLQRWVAHKPRDFYIQVPNAYLYSNRSRWIMCCVCFFLINMSNIKHPVHRCTITKCLCCYLKLCCLKNPTVFTTKEQFNCCTHLSHDSFSTLPT